MRKRKYLILIHAKITLEQKVSKFCMCPSCCLHPGCKSCNSDALWKQCISVIKYWLLCSICKWVTIVNTARSTCHCHVTFSRNVNNVWGNWLANDGVHAEFRHFSFLSYFVILAWIKMYYTVFFECVASVYVKKIILLYTYILFSS